ncbi:MAG: Mth938-like domain-containing protein [Gammaproteobacteria bacterium]|nr:Mth938-like domain-containing protein [Gammaproteobacteria bacterium]
MKLELDSTGEGGNRIDSYGPGHVVVGTVTYAHSVVLTPGEMIDPWPPGSFEELAPHHFESIAALQPEVVLLGTGRRLRFPASAVLDPLTTRNIGVEVMDTGAVCRSFNFLAAEGRRVAAALLMIEG